jgi:hypothetical protein
LQEKEEELVAPVINAAPQIYHKEEEKKKHAEELKIKVEFRDN